MNTGEFTTALKPFKKMLRRGSLSPTIRALCLSGKGIRATSTYAALEVNAELPLDREIFVDGMTLIAVAESLPPGQELTLQADDNVLTYTAGSTKGRLAQMVIEEMRGVPRVRQEPWKANHSFIQALELGAISCDNDALATIGMYGITIDRRNTPVVRSTDNVTISSCEFDGEGFTGPELITIVPEAASLLVNIMKLDGKMVITEQGIHYQDKQVRCFVALCDPLRSDLGAIREQFAKADAVVPLPRDRVLSFNRRALALADNKRHAAVRLETADGKLVLGFEEGIAQTEEFYLIDEGNIPDLEAVKLDGQKLARALQHVSEVVLDYMAERDALLFRSEEPPFEYLIMGKR